MTFRIVLLSVALAATPILSSRAQVPANDPILALVESARKKAEEALAAKAEAAELHKQLTGARLTVIQAENAAKKEIEKLRVNANSLRVTVITDKFDFNKVYISDIAGAQVTTLTVEQLDYEISARKAKLAELQGQPDNAETRTVRTAIQRDIGGLEIWSKHPNAREGQREGH